MPRCRILVNRNGSTFYRDWPWFSCQSGSNVLLLLRVSVFALRHRLVVVVGRGCGAGRTVVASCRNESNACVPSMTPRPPDVVVVVVVVLVVDWSLRTSCRTS